MAEQELENLRAALLEKGVTAPKSWKEPRLKKELAALEASETKPEQNTSSNENTDDLNESTDDSEEQDELTEEDSTQAPSADEITNVSDESNNNSATDLDENANDDAAIDDKVSVKAKAAFSNERLNLKGIKVGTKLSVSPQDAKFLVETDRTCEYVND